LKILGVGNEGMSTLPRLNQIQFEGFCRFIDRGLAEELFMFPKIEISVICGNISIGRTLDKRKKMLYMNHLHIPLNYIYPRD